MFSMSKQAVARGTYVSLHLQYSWCSTQELKENSFFFQVEANKNESNETFRWAILAVLCDEVGFLLLNHRLLLRKNSGIMQLSAPFTNYMNNYPFPQQMKQSLPPPLTLCLCYNIVHLSWVKETQSGRHAGENQTLNSHNASESHLNIRSHSEGKWSHSPGLALLMQSLSRGVMNGLHQSHSQPQPKLITGLAGLVFIVGLRAAHAQFPICSSFMKRPLPQSPRSQVEGEWCFCCAGGCTPRIPAMLNVASFLFFIFFFHFFQPC